MEGDNQPKEGETIEGEIATALERQSSPLPSTEFVKVEKNLASLGFFTPSSKRLRNAQEKSFTMTTIADGQRLEVKGTIIPSAKYGLPITADQDKWIALCKILTDILRKEGKVSNPIAFTSADILRLLHKHRHSGKNYREVEEWLDVLFSTTIFSEGVVYLANEKRRVKDRFRVFDRAVSFGKELPDGKMADKNYVWFSDWQLQNINSNYLLPIDLEAYRELKNHIAKALVPLLQIWLYATRDEGVFEKKYEELCQILNIQQYKYLSLIRRTLEPSLNELKQVGYLADWQIEKTTDGESYKVAFYHGEKFHRDQRVRLSRKRPLTPAGEQPVGNDRPPRHHTVKVNATPAAPSFDPQLVAEFARRGIAEKKTAELLAKLKPDQDVVAQLELGDHLIQNGRVPIVNPAGFYIHLIQNDTPVPEGFETTAKRKAREENERKERERRAAEETRQLLEWEYDEYCQREVARFIQTDPGAFAAIRDAKWSENRARYQTFSDETITSMSAREAKSVIRRQIDILTIEEFAIRKEQGTIALSEAVEEPDIQTKATSSFSESASSIEEPFSIAPAVAAGEEVIMLPAAGELIVTESTIEVLPAPLQEDTGDDSIERLAA